MKKTLSLVLVSIIILTTAVVGVLAKTPDILNGNWGENLTWEFDESTGELIISGVGEMSVTSIIPSTEPQTEEQTEPAVYEYFPWYSWRSSIKSIVISEGVESICVCAFYKCDNLKIITIPESVTLIDGGAFDCCYSITDVYYGSSEKDWNNVKFGSYNQPLLNATIHYNSKVADKTYEVGDVIEFGSYPQSKVKDNELIKAFNSIPKSWISYEYFKNGKKADYMYYFDFEYEGNCYRAVYFTEYRPLTANALESGGTQYGNGYYCNEVYYFKFEPLKWKILDTEQGLVVCDNIIDSQPYIRTYYTQYYQCIYDESYIRSWLNDTFFVTAFDSNQQSVILETEYEQTNYVYDSASSQYSGVSMSYKLSDRIFLLSKDDVVNKEYGYVNNGDRIVNETDYANCQGLGYDVNKWYSLRTSSKISDSGVINNNIVISDGTSGYRCDSQYTIMGVVPAMRVDIETVLDALNLKPGETGSTVYENLDYYIEEDDAHKKLSMQVTLEDEWFAEDSAAYNHDLGGFCSQFTVLGYTKASHMLTDEQKENGTRPAGYMTKNQVLKKALTKMGFSDPEVNLSTNREEVNYFIAHKNITVSGENKTLIFTGFIGSYHDQWYSNFDPGTEDTHKGFNNAKEFVLGKLRNYIEKLDCDVNSTEILITGHSRGAATANLVAAQLIEEATYAFGDEGYAFKENIHTYTFATPNPTTLIDTTYEEYKRIFNIVNPEDFVTKCMPAAWGYARYGTTYVLPSKTNTSSGNYKFLKANMQNYFSSITNGREYKPYALGEGDTFIVYKSLTGVVRNAWMFEHLPLLAGPMNITPRDFFQNTLCHFVSDTASGLDFTYAGYIIAETLSLPLLSSKVYTDVLKYFLWNGTALNPRFKDAHMAETYCAYMMTMPKAELVREKEALLNTVNCPVDIEVIDKETGDVVGRIVNNVIDEEIASKDNAIVMTVDGDSKSFWLPSDGDYDVRLTGNDEGTMDYTVSEIDSNIGETQRVNFFDVSITDGKEMTGEINSEDFVLEEYTLSFEDESAPDMIPTEIMSGDEIVNYNIEVSAEGYGSATNSMTVSSGDYVSLTATPYEGNEFLGWYEGSKLISTDMQYSFVAKSDREITAKFKAIIGDVNSDGKINSTDALLCLQHSVGKIKLEGDAFTAADVDKNGFINSSDALKILQFSVGKIEKL